MKYIQKTSGHQRQVSQSLLRQSMSPMKTNYTRDDSEPQKRVSLDEVKDKTRFKNTNLVHTFEMNMGEEGNLLRSLNGSTFQAPSDSNKQALR